MALIFNLCVFFLFITNLLTTLEYFILNGYMSNLSEVDNKDREQLLNRHGIAQLIFITFRKTPSV